MVTQVRLSVFIEIACTLGVYMVSICPPHGVHVKDNHTKKLSVSSYSRRKRLELLLSQDSMTLSSEFIVQYSKRH